MLTLPLLLDLWCVSLVHTVQILDYLLFIQLSPFQPLAIQDENGIYESNMNEEENPLPQVGLPKSVNSKHRQRLYMYFLLPGLAGGIIESISF